MRKDKNTPEVEWYNVLIGYLFPKAWPIWKTHKGKVPDDALEQLERDGDWPCGLAMVIMQRLSQDAALRKQLEDCPR